MTISKSSTRLQRAKQQLVLPPPQMLQLLKVFQNPRLGRHNSVVFRIYIHRWRFGVMSLVYYYLLQERYFYSWARLASVTTLSEISISICTLLSCHEILPQWRVN